MVLATLSNHQILVLKRVSWERNRVNQGPIDTIDLDVHSMGLLEAGKSDRTLGRSHRTCRWSAQIRRRYLDRRFPPNSVEIMVNRVHVPLIPGIFFTSGGAMSLPRWCREG